MRKFLSYFLLSACLDCSAQTKDSDNVISADRLLEHIKVLASDEFEGRGPGSKGEELTVKYLTDQFQSMGLAPGNPDGTYVQKVPLAGIRGLPSAHFVINGKPSEELKFPSDYVATSTQLKSEVKVTDSDVVFVGYGVVAPEYGWDDYKGLDVRGKTLLMLINDPPVPDPDHPGQLDPKMFKGAAMTYYGRWSYKYEIAAEKGAAAAIIVHETGPAAYPYSVVEMSWAKENFVIDSDDKNNGAVPVRAWVTLDIAKKLCADCGQDFDALKSSAVSRDFKPVALPAKASFEIHQRVRPFMSRNVVAKVAGTDSALRNEWMIYSAHWDHLGRHPELQGDQIFNGAVDNATGVAGLLELARAHQLQPSKRSTLFLAPTAEEAGLLGAFYYAAHPLVPLTKTLGDINMDGLNVMGRARDVEDMTGDSSTFSDVLKTEATLRGRVVEPDGDPEKGYYYRADQFEFVKAGLPSLYIFPGLDVIGKPPGYGRQMRDEYIAHRYHQPSDEVDPSWDLSGAAEDVELLLAAGRAVENGSAWPEWKPGSEFKAKREAMLQAK